MKVVVISSRQEDREVGVVVGGSWFSSFWFCAQPAHGLSFARYGSRSFYNLVFGRFGTTDLDIFGEPRTDLE